jgi:hypothetical protein
MQWTGGVFAAMVVVVGCVGSAGAGQPGCTNCNRTAKAGPWTAEACAAPAGFGCLPGCCEERRHCCDNAWAGYCEHHARVEAFWAGVGVFDKPNRQHICRYPCEPAAATPMTTQTPHLAPTTKAQPSTTKKLPPTEAPMPPALQAPLPPEPALPAPAKPKPAKSASAKLQKADGGPFILGQW